VQYWGQTTQRWAFDGLSVSLTKYPAAQIQTRHRHENPTFFFLLGGEFGDFSTERGSLYPRRFDLLYHPAGAWHESRCGDDGRWGLNLEPSSQWLSQLELSGSDFGIYRLESDPFRCSELLRLLLLGFESPSAEDQLFEILLAPRESAEESRSWLRRLDELVREDAARWRLNTLARELAVHPVYLARTFRARYGCSVTEWLNRRRLVESARALLEGRQVSEISHELGFADQSHFGRAFRGLFGTAPTQFQRFHFF
jgi:AraC family transcriptional regulator